MLTKLQIMVIKEALAKIEKAHEIISSNGDNHLGSPHNSGTKANDAMRSMISAESWLKSLLEENK